MKILQKMSRDLILKTQARDLILKARIKAQAQILTDQIQNEAIEIDHQH